MEKEGVTLLITPEDLASYLRCSQFFSFSGRIKEDTTLELTRRTLEEFFLFFLREPNLLPIDYLHELNSITQKLKTRLEKKNKNMAADIMRHVLSFMNQILVETNLLRGIALSSSHEWKLKVSNSLVSVRVSAAYRTLASKFIQVIYFSPYMDKHSIGNDPMIPLILESANYSLDNYKDKTETVILHVIGYNGKDLIYLKKDSRDKRDNRDKITALIKQIESGYAFPIVPCTYRNCEFRKRCFLE